MALTFAHNSIDFQSDYSQCLDTLFAAKYDPNTWTKEENFINLFARCTQDCNEILEQDMLFESYEKKAILNEFMWEYEKKLSEEARKMHGELEKEFMSFEEAIGKAQELCECERELENEKVEFDEARTKLELLESDTNGLREMHQSQLDMIASLQQQSKTEPGADKSSASRGDSTLIHIAIVEALLGLRNVDDNLPAIGQQQQQSDQSQQDRFDMMFMSLSDECLNCESDTYMKNKQSQIVNLSAELLDKYRAIYKRRKLQNNQHSAAASYAAKNAPSGLIVNNYSDFKAVYENFPTLLCSYLTKQEIEKAGKRFGLDWIEGSPVISILIDSKATKMATIVLPKYYPLCGTSLIKLTSMTGYDNAAIKNFRIEKNFNSLVEWIERFIDLYNTNQLEL